MEEIILNTLSNYYQQLKRVGYYSDKYLINLYLTVFIKNFLNDYTGKVSMKDYQSIMNLVECLAGEACVFNYADFVKYRETLCEIPKSIKTFRTSSKFDKLLPIYEQLSHVRKVADDISNTKVVKSDFNIDFEYE